jgi:hypothetical protein
VHQRQTEKINYSVKYGVDARQAQKSSAVT